MRFLFLTCFVILFFSCDHLLQSKAESCQIDDTGISRGTFEVKLPRQNIGVIGWYHGTFERQAAIVALETSMKEARTRKCSAAQKTIKTYLKTYSEQKTEGLRVYNELEKLYLKHPFTAIGLEASPEQYADWFFNVKTQKDTAQEIVPDFKKKCPQLDQDIVALALVFPGPEVEFARRKNGLVKLVPMGNQALVLESLSGLSEESRTFAAKAVLTPKAELAYSSFGKLVLSGQPITPDKIEILLADVEDSGKPKLRKYFSEAAHVINLIDRRNQLILEQAFSANQDTVIVVGNAHIPGLHKDLQKKCAKP